MSDFFARIMTSLVLLPLIISAVWFGGVWFLTLLTFVGLALIWEWGRFIDDRKFSLLTTLYVFALLGILLILWQSLIFDSRSVMVIAIASFGALMIAWITKRDKGLALIGVVYLLLPLVLLADLRSDMAEGRIAVLLLLLMVWASDVGAYFIGRGIGGKRLAPHISEHKTWSGALGGVSASILLAASAVWLLSLSPRFIFWGLLLSFATQIGDLLESWLKRRHQIKDMSALLPGHGGFLDRVDGLIIATFVFYLIMWLMGWPNQSAAVLFIGF